VAAKFIRSSCVRIPRCLLTLLLIVSASKVNGYLRPEVDCRSPIASSRSLRPMLGLIENAGGYLWRGAVQAFNITFGPISALSILMVYENLHVRLVR
jgi:hypothetical protein